MFPIVLAALSGLVAGTADFAGGKASQRGKPLAVTVTSQLIGFPLLLVCVLLVPGRPTVADLAWGAAAGIAGLAGIVLLYRGLAGGAMAVVAPITAVTAAIIPVGVGLLTSRTPGFLVLGGVALAILAIGLVSLGSGSGRAAVSPQLVGLALAAGAFFGLFFTLFAQPSQAAGMWPLLAVRVGSIGVGVVIMLRTRTSFRLAPVILPWAAVAGTLEIVGNALYLAAAARGHLSVVAALASLYPISTVLLALVVDRERLRPVQFAGLGLAALAIVLATS
jgi:drug/metabolite transporter (DMT)-like permease